MNTRHAKYLLVGGGLAGSSAAEAIRQRDPEGAILLIGQEVNRPYHRPPLSKDYLRRERTRTDLWTHPVGWYEQNGVQLRTGHRVSHLDCPRRAVTLSSGEVISFENLLLAIGAAPRLLQIPGADLPNVFYLRTLEDADRIQHAIEKARTEGRPHGRGRGQVAVIGGGVLGVELCGSLTQLGLKVHLLTAQQPWSKFAGEGTGRFVARYLEDHGVTVHTGQRPQRLDGDGRVQRIVLPSGTTIDCDFVAAAVGIQVNRDLLRGTPIAAERAILTDDHCRTNVPNIYAAGDCTALFDPLFGKHRLIDHWDHARRTGALAGANMAGADQAYDAVDYFSSESFDLSLSAWGEPRLVSHRLVRGNPTLESPAMIEFGVAADGRIAQILALNHTTDDATLRQLVHHRIRIDGNEEALKDPHYNLAHLVP
jgi:3-phenylpropionate/trans-cinnamate dioxygenase ferredoxin reductase component